jgi:hypothetical protein
VPAQAKPYEHASFADTEIQEFEECGKHLRSEFVYEATSIIRAGKHDLDTAFFGHFMLDAVDTITNLENGKFLTIEIHAMTKDVQAERVSGSIFESVTIEVGQPFTLRDMSGEIVIRDRGQLRFTYLFDTEGDDVPGGIFIEELSVKVAGPHAGFEMEWCEVMDDLIG